VAISSNDEQERDGVGSSTTVEITKSESADFREVNRLLILPALFVLNRFSSILFDLASRELHRNTPFAA
jgi:hypothetical protein